MRVLLLLVVIAVMGFGLVQWLDRKAPAPALAGQAPTAVPVPAVPTRPQEVAAFSQDLTRLVQDDAKNPNDESACGTAATVSNVGSGRCARHRARTPGL